MAYDSRPETQGHIVKVQNNIKLAILNLEARARVHDTSKLLPPEVAVFDEFTPRLEHIEYGSQEYEDCRAAMAVALEHHYAENDHHPEHYPNGISGMSLLALIEMICDWKAASERMKKTQTPAAPGRADVQYDSDLEASIMKNQVRFGYTDELCQILINTAHELGFIPSKEDNE